MKFLRAVKSCTLADTMSNADTTQKLESFDLENKITDYRQNRLVFRPSFPKRGTSDDT